VHRYRFIIASIVALAAVSVLFSQQPETSEWKVVEDAINQGLPTTAIEKLEPIITAAQAEQRFAAAIKAVALKISLQASIQGNRPEEKITRMQAAIEQSPAEMKPLLQAILANWYWHYFQQNRWRFLQRTATDPTAPPADDFTTWSLPQILTEIDSQFTRALSHTALLKQTPIAEYDELLEQGTAPDAYRPTLYDFVAHDALAFYQSGEQAGNRAIDAFDLSAASPIFAPAAEFQNWKPATDDRNSLTLKAVTIYQDLLNFHQDDPDPTAFLDADYWRLQFGNNQAFGEEKAARYKAALRRFADDHTEHEISTRAIADLAQVVHGEGDWVAARQIAQQGLDRFPESVGGARCHNLIQQILAKESSVTTERVWNDPRPTIDVQYRNLTSVHFRLVAWDFDEFVSSNRWQAEQLDQAQQQELLQRKPIRQWSADLPATEDYQLRVEQIATPQDLPPGSYYLIASHNDQFSDQENQLSFTEVWVSDLALVTRSPSGRAVIDGFVMQASSGAPIGGATVQAWRRDNQNQLQPLPPQQTDENGHFQFSSDDHRQILLLAKHNGHALSSRNHLNSHHRSFVPPSEQTMFFTDRSLYRPGQTIQFKGICIDVDRERDRYQTISAREVSIVFIDSNGKEIERIKQRTNDYGSFSGSFTAPRDRLMGQMQIRVETGPPGAASVTVEEYKRPKFQVRLEPPREPAKLNRKVEIQGTAMAYTGAAINDATVRWRVVRQVEIPIWWRWSHWWMPPRGGESQEIAHGVATTSAAGTFDISFTAQPDPETDAESEPNFRFTIYADVTDTTGETRSNQRSINLGYTALRASLTTGDWLTDNEPVQIRVRTETLDGESQAASGKVTVFALQQPQQIERSALSPIHRPWRFGQQPPAADPSNPNSWPVGEVVQERDFATDASGQQTIALELPAGMYRAKLQSKDSFGNAVTAELPLQVLDPDAKQLALKIPSLLVAQQQSWEPGETYQAIWGSGYDTARAFVEVEHRGELLQSYWTEPGVTQVAINQPIQETMRGGFHVRTTMVRENRAYMQSQHVQVPWTNKQLAIKWEHFVSKLQPAAKEKFTAIIRGADAQQAVAEMVATMYDASLDAFLPHRWPDGFDVFRTDRSDVHSMFENQLLHLQHFAGQWNIDQRSVDWSYRHFPERIIQDIFGNQFGRMRRGLRVAEDGVPAAEFAAAAPMSAKASPVMAGGPVSADADAAGGQQQPAEPSPDLSNVSARRNLNETAFFFPQLVSAEDGTVRIEFTMPEALTEWKFMGFAHDQNLRSGLLTGTTVTAKDLMVQPNPPRFLREGDVIEFTAKVSNQSPTLQSGTARLSFADARTAKSVDDRMNHHVRDQAFEIPAGESRSLSWRITVPDDLGPIIYTAVASTGKLSDGEEGMIPVLSRQILVTESLQLPIRGPQTKQFQFSKLLDSGNSDSLRHKSLTVQMVSNPAWYAVLALPYLMEYPHQCSEQTFSRLYANSLARHIVNSDQKIGRVFANWRGTDALDSPLEKNEELKSVLLDETPWYRHAQTESQARRNVGVLFDDNRLDAESARALNQLTEMQLADGSWPWFPGGSGNDFITLYITTGFGRLRHLGVDVDPTVAIRSLQRLDRWATDRYNEVQTADQDKNHLSTTIALYLYGRSFFLQDQAIAPEHQQAVDYWLRQAAQHWLQLGHRQSQAHLAVALKRFVSRDAKHLEAAQGIMRSLAERSIRDEEMGMFWRDQEASWWWYAAPIETQAMMIEAFDEVMNDKQAVQDCQVWLLKQKQTRDWRTTKATADAVYALLLRGSDLLGSDDLVQVTLGDQTIKPVAVEAGTGFYEHRFVGSQVRPELGQITVTKTDQGVAWGGVHWQYLEDMDQITPHAGTPLTLTKELYVKRNTDQGPQLAKVSGPVDVGAELVVRLVLRSDRDMEFVHLKDYRGSGTEPVNVLSRYQFQDGLGYFESTRDTASHFFISYLPKGTYVFEYSTRVQLRGAYQMGIANIECMYAPEFNSHSESIGIEVK
jgi:hypothetical protein